MAATVEEVRQWLDTLDDGVDTLVAISDGGLALVANDRLSYFEIGGIPEGDENQYPDM